MTDTDFTGAIMPDGSAYEEWQFLHQNNENTEVHKEEEILEKLPDNLISTSEVLEE